jgi:transcriptional regulator with XRE-family HTH domain
MSQETLAAEAGLQRKYISLLERATYQPKIGTVFSLALALECKPSEFMALIEDEIRSSPS